MKTKSGTIQIRIDNEVILVLKEKARLLKMEDEPLNNVLRALLSMPLTTYRKSKRIAAWYDR